MKKIVLTGGGTAGHVTPNIALLPKLKEAGYEIYYIGSYDGIEKKLIEEFNIPYFGISSGKLRRYFDIKNFTDPFKVLKGYSEAAKLMKKIKPDVVFSKGGFVTVPVVIAAHRKKIPTIIHESDMTPGLANKLCIPSATKICCNFPETISHLPEGKANLTGSPIRAELLSGNKDEARKFCGFSDDKPVVLIIGGSLGAAAVNDAVRKILPQLLPKYNVIHLCGKGKLDESLKGTAGYVPNILIPLPAAASRGDQILNANSFKKQGFSEVIDEEKITDDLLLETINNVYNNRSKYVEAMEKSPQQNGVEAVISLIKEVTK